MITIYTTQPPRYSSKISHYNLTVLAKIWNIIPKGTGRNGKILKDDLFKAIGQNKGYDWPRIIWGQVSIGKYMSTSFYTETKYFHLMVKEYSNDPNIERYELPLEQDKDKLIQLFGIKHINSYLSQILEYNIKDKQWVLNNLVTIKPGTTIELEYNKLRKCITYIDIFYVFVKLRYLYQNIDFNADVLNYTIQYYFIFFDPEILTNIKIL